MTCLILPVVDLVPIDTIAPLDTTGMTIEEAAAAQAALDAAGGRKMLRRRSL